MWLVILLVAMPYSVLSSVIRNELGLPSCPLVTLLVAPHSDAVVSVVTSGRVMVRHMVAMLLSEYLVLATPATTVSLFVSWHMRLLLAITLAVLEMVIVVALPVLRSVTNCVSCRVGVTVDLMLLMDLMSVGPDVAVAVDLLPSFYTVLSVTTLEVPFWTMAGGQCPNDRNTVASALLTLVVMGLSI